MTIGEFDLIARYFAPLASEGAPAFGLSDDAAVLNPPKDRDLVLTKDALVGDVHFFSDDPADLIARKAMAVNLSDLAAMGATPLGYLLALALPKNMPDIESWVQKFTDGLQQGQAAYDWSLLGGDTVSTAGPLTLSLTAIGSVKKGEALRRDGAKTGDHIYVSGTLGDAALGLRMLQGEIADRSQALIDRYHLPEPRLELGQKLYGIATAVMDISDGLAGDIAHICRHSGVGADIEADRLPRSLAAGKILESFPRYNCLQWNGGDDYELLITAPAHAEQLLKEISQDVGVPLTHIGQMTTEKKISILDTEGQNLLSDNQGYRHF